VQARAALVQVAEREARLIDAQLEKAADMARSAAGYLAAQLGAETPPQWNTSSLRQMPEGVIYDANPRRRSDVWLPNFLALEGRTLRDLTASSVLDPLFSTFLALDPDAVAIYYGSTKGAMRYYPALGLHARLSPSLDFTKDAGFTAFSSSGNPEQRTIWSDPYIDRAGQGRLVTVVTPVYATGAFRGVIGVDVSLARLATRLGELEPAPGGYAFVVDRLGRLVSAPPEALKPLLKQAKTASSLQSLADIGDATFRASVSEMRRGESGSGQLMVAGEQVMMAYAPLPNLGWSLALVTPQRELTKVSDNLVAAIGRDAGDAVRSSLLLTAAFFLLGLIGVTTFSRQFLTAPIARLTKAARAVAAGDLSVTLPLTSRNDLGVLAESFNHMTRELSANEARLRAQSEALAESEARFRMMADSAPVMVWMSGHDNYEDYFNKQWLDFTGRSLEQEVGKGWLEGVHPDHVERCVKAYDQAYAARQAFEVDYRLRRADGVYRWVLDRATPRFHTDGSFAGFIGSCFDVTERIESRTLLEERVRERTRS
jgi:PAS domain S-box-containing protein